MTAPSLNTATVAPPGAPSAAAAKPGQATGVGHARAGFDALVAALFPNVPPDAQPATSTGASLFAPLADGQLLVEAKGEAVSDDDASADPEADAAETGAAADPQGLAACLLATPRPTTEALLTAKAPTADGRPGVVPVARGAAERFVPTLPGKTEPAPEAADAGEDTAGALPDPTASLPTAATRAPEAAPPAWSRTRAPAAPAQPALEAANPNADLAAKATTADAAAEAQAAPATTPAPIAQAAADAAKLPATLAPPPAARPEPAPVKSARSERGKSETTTPDALKPLEAADKPVHAKAAEGAARTASAAVEAAEQPEAREARADTDNSDAALQGETRATTSSAAPAAPAGHQVRGAPETVANLAAQIIKKLEARTTRFDLELDPHGLGRVDVRVEIGAHGKMTASMVFENPQAAHELKARAAELQRTLEQAGFDLSGGMSFDVADQGRQQGQSWQDQADNGRAFRGQAFRAALETAGDAADTANLGALRLRRGVNAGVDVRI